MILLTKGTDYFWSIKTSNDVLNNQTFIGRIPNIWLATKNVLFSLLMYIIITIYGRVKKSVMPLFIFWIIFLLDLEINFIGKLLVF